jgi:hypothetical protein
MTDYLKFYDDERYLFKEVGRDFRATGVIEPADFYMILIWKAERAKNRHRDRLKRIAAGSFQEAVEQIAGSLHASHEQKQRLQLLMCKWEFALPTASAILTVLYPDEFTVYDRLVCKELKIKYQPQREFSDALWADYGQFREAVINSEAPVDLCLRNKDRFLVARSFRKGVEHDCKA